MIDMMIITGLQTHNRWVRRVLLHDNINNFQTVEDVGAIDSFIISPLCVVLTRPVTTTYVPVLIESRAIRGILANPLIVRGVPAIV